MFIVGFWKAYKTVLQKRNPKEIALGKAFVFVLAGLIIVSFFIFMLFSVSYMMILIPRRCATDEVRVVMASLVDSPGALRMTKESPIDNSKELDSVRIAERLPISSRQICMSLGEFGESPEFELLKHESGQAIKYNGQSSAIVKIAVVCDRDLNLLETDLEDYGLDYPDLDCGGCEPGQTCCAVILRRA